MNNTTPQSSMKRFWTYIKHKRFVAVVFPIRWKLLITKQKAIITCTTLTLLFNLSTFYTVAVVPDQADVTRVFCSFSTHLRVITDVLTFVFGSA
ncbi:hypothetical protein ACOMHN_056781 [Nucella lapillus]